MNPEHMLDKLKKNVSRKTAKTLDSIFNICNEQIDRGVSDFSFVTIAKLGHLRGVPNAQSMRNETGEVYRGLIKSFADFDPLKNIEKISKTDESWIDEISSPKHRLLARIQASELKATLSKLKEIIPPNTVIEIYDNKNASVSADHRLTGSERNALKYLISNSFKSRWNFSETEFGELMDENGKIVFKPATIDAIKKALDYL